MPMRKTGPFELTFWGGTTVDNRRTHLTLDSARIEAERVLAKISNRAAHPAVIYEDGKRQPVATVN
jgi:hypothetical protein